MIPVNYFTKWWCTGIAWITTCTKCLQKQPLKLMYKITIQITEAVTRRYSVKKVFLKIRKNHKKTSVMESLFKNVANLKACNYIKKILQHVYLAVNFAKVLRTPFLQKTTASEIKTNLLYINYIKLLFKITVLMRKSKHFPLSYIWKMK